jgi:hypothetical protein
MTWTTRSLAVGPKPSETRFFNYNFQKWVYVGTDYYCNFGFARTSPSPSTSLLGDNNCPAGSAVLFFKIRKAFVIPQPPPGETAPTSYPSVANYSTTIYGPSEVKPSTSCNWYASNPFTGSQWAVFQWFIDDESVGSNQDVWHTSASSGTFEIMVLISDDQGNWATATREITISSGAATCYVE